MATLTDAQIAGYAKGAGFKGSDLVIAVAVVHPESGARTDAVNSSNSDGSKDYGLWQINSSHSALLATGSWFNPADNARMAYSVWQSQGWHAWSTYNNGAYLPFMAQALAASNSPALKSGANSFADSKAPYAPGTLKAPLTPSQKVAVLAYIKPSWTADTQPAWAAFLLYSDAAIINTYNHLASAGSTETGDPGEVTPGVGPLPTPDLSGIAAFVKFITSGSTYLRAGMFLAGMALLLIGLLGMQRVTSAVKKTTGNLAKVAVVA